MGRGKPSIEWPGHDREPGQAGYVDVGTFVAVAERLEAVETHDAAERAILAFLAALCRRRAESVLDARARLRMRGQEEGPTS